MFIMLNESNVQERRVISIFFLTEASASFYSMVQIYSSEQHQA